MNTKFLLFITGLMIAFNLLSQNPGQDYTNRMNYIFQYIDKNKITTGLLIDYGLYAVEPDIFDGPTARFVFKSNLWYKNVSKTIPL